MAARRRYWLMKTEPDAFSIDDLERLGESPWDGVRNYQSRNFMRDEMRAGDGVLLYHSSANPSGVAGVARVSGPARPDPSALDRKSRYFDPKATPQNPIWVLVDVAFIEKFPRIVTLEELKADGELEGMWVRRRGMRLSIQPVEPAHFRRVVAMGRGKANLAP